MAKAKSKRLRVSGIFVAVILVFSAFQFVGQYQVLKDMKGELDVLSSEYNQVVAQGRELEKQRNKLTDPIFIEQLARQNLRMVRPGEYLVIPAEEGNGPNLSNENIDINDLH